MTWTVLNSAGAVKQVLASDHGSLSGLTDDDHTQYALLAGRSSGQVLTGGTAASDGLSFDSTSNATKGVITFGGVGAGSNAVIGGGTSASELRLLEASGSGTNYSAFKAQAQSGNITYTLPAADGSASQVLSTNGSGTLSWATSSGGGFTLGTEQASTSGTSIDFTGIPSGTKFIMVLLDNVGTNGTSPVQIQIGDSGGIETTGYDSTASTQRDLTVNFVTSVSSGFHMLIDDATAARHGIVYLALEDSTNNEWVSTHAIRDSVTGNIGTGVGGGSKALSATLDRVRITTISATNSFDEGAINILYSS